MRVFAGHLIACEMTANKSSGTNSLAAFSVCERLGPRLTALVGHGGFHALLARVLSLTQAEAPALLAVRVSADGSWEGVDELEALAESGGIAGGGVILVAHLLGLLEAFIGENLTLRLVRETWPGLSLNDQIEKQDESV
ncbi:MAG: hypothetical protein JWM59_1516 [Verrucomicrobiales bacterium]|nr:hypothetical protein [Verrucomicrobiales bacterium]